MDQMDRVDRMEQMDRIIQMDRMNQMDRIIQMDWMDQIDQFDGSNININSYHIAFDQLAHPPACGACFYHIQSSLDSIAVSLFLNPNYSETSKLV